MTLLQKSSASSSYFLALSKILTSLAHFIKLWLDKSLVSVFFHILEDVGSFLFWSPRSEGCTIFAGYFGAVLIPP